MSSSNSHTERTSWHVQIRCNPEVYDTITKEAKREERSMSYMVSRILEKHYEEKTKLKVV